MYALFSVLGSRPTASNIPGSLKNNSAITITSKTGPRPGFHRTIRPSMMGPNKMGRPMLPGQKIADIRNRLGELRSYSAMRAKSPMQARLLRPTLPGSVSITKIPKDVKKPEAESSENNIPSRVEVTSDDDTHVLDSDEDDSSNKQRGTKPTVQSSSENDQEKPTADSSESLKFQETNSIVTERESRPEPESLVLTTDEKLPSEEVFENKHSIEENQSERYQLSVTPKVEIADVTRNTEAVERKINPLKNYRHQRPSGRPSLESSLSQLERTASVLNKEGMPDFRKNLDDITQSYSPTGEEKPGVKLKKKRSPTKLDATPESQVPVGSGMSHSVSSLLGPTTATPRQRKAEMSPSNATPIAPVEACNTQSRLMNRSSLESPVGHSPLMQSHPNHLTKSLPAAITMAHPAMMSGGTAAPAVDPSKSQTPSPLPTPSNHMFPSGHPSPEGQYGYPGIPRTFILLHFLYFSEL